MGLQCRPIGKLKGVHVKLDAQNMKAKKSEKVKEEKKK